MSETILVQLTRLTLSDGGTRLFRNNAGALKDIKGRLVRFGLCVGSSDLIGWQTITITDSMVGKRVAVFTALEGKVPGAKPTKEQAAFIRTVKDAGGIAGVFTSVEQARALLEQRP